MPCTVLAPVNFLQLLVNPHLLSNLLVLVRFQLTSINNKQHTANSKYRAAEQLKIPFPFYY